MGFIIDRSLSNSIHIAKVKARTNTRNNVRKKLSNSKWDANLSTIRTTALALNYSTAEYACPLWQRSAHVHKVNPVLNHACRSITGCLPPSIIDNVYLLADITPLAIRRSVAAHREMGLQVNNTRHPLHFHAVPRKDLKPRSSFMHATDELIESPSARRIGLWTNHLQSVTNTLIQTSSKSLANGASSTRSEWKYINGLQRWDATNTT